MSPRRRLRRRAWDANAFLGILLGEADKVGSCKAVLREARDGKLVILTSAVTIAEVIKVKGQPKLSQEIEQKIIDTFKHEYIVVWDCTRKVAEKARELMWQYDFLKHKDAIHVATAVLAEVEQLDTFDDDLIKISERMGDPPLKIGKPNVPSQEELALAYPEGDETADLDGDNDDDQET